MYVVGLTIIYAALTMLVLALIVTKPMVKILQMNRKVLMPIIVALTVAGAYASRATVFDIRLMLVMGIIGFILRKFNIPLAPLTLGLILGGTADTSFRQALTQSNGSLIPLLSRGMGLVLLAVVAYTLISGVIKTVKDVKRQLSGEAKEI